MWKNDEGRELDNISFSFFGPSGVKGRPMSGDKIGVWSGVTGTLLFILAFSLVGSDLDSRALGL